MKEYKFVNACANMKGISVGTKKIKENCEKLINQHAAEGWRVVQIIRLGEAVGMNFEILFERDKISEE